MWLDRNLWPLWKGLGAGSGLTDIIDLSWFSQLLLSPAEI